MKKLLITLYLIAQLCLFQVMSVTASGFGMEERIHKRIAIIQTLLGNKKYDEAIERLDTLSVTVKSMPYETGVVLQLYGYVYSQKGDTDKAISYFSQCIELQSLPVETLQNVRLNIIQLHIDKKQYSDADKMFIQWKNAGAPLAADGYALGGINYALQKRYQDAEKELVIATQLAKPPKEEWLQALLSIYLDSKKYSKAAELLESMVVSFAGKKEYWIQLADVYYLLKQYEKAASVLDVAYHKNYITASEEYKKISAIHYYNRDPYNAAKYLEQAVNKQILKPDHEVYKQLAIYYLSAKDTGSALKYLEKSVKMTNDIKLQYTIAQIYYENQNLQAAQDMLDAITKSDNQNMKNQALLLTGVIYFDQKKYKQSVNAFEQIAFGSALYEEAQNWKKYVDTFLGAENQH